MITTFQRDWHQVLGSHGGIPNSAWRAGWLLWGGEAQDTPARAGGSWHGQGCDGHSTEGVRVCLGAWKDHGAPELTGEERRARSERQGSHSQVFKTGTA